MLKSERILAWTLFYKFIIKRNLKEKLIFAMKRRPNEAPFKINENDLDGKIILGLKKHIINNARSCHILMSLFIWEDTLEGFRFWKNFDDEFSLIFFKFKNNLINK